MREYKPDSLTNKVVRIGKYMVPLGAMLPPLRTSKAPVRQIALRELENEQPTIIKTKVLGSEPEFAASQFAVIRSGEISYRNLATFRSPDTLIATIFDGSSVGRSCSLVTPENSAIRETGFFLDRGDFLPFAWQKLDPRYWQHRYRGDLTARFRLPEEAYLPGRIAALNNQCSHNFYHWMVEVAPRIAALDMANVSVDGYLVDHQSSYQKRILTMLGIPSSKWIQPHCSLKLSADEMIWVSHPGIMALRHFVSMLQPSIPEPTEPKRRRIYISRRNANHRRLKNESELENYLAGLGFESFSFETIPIDKQCSLIRESDIVVTVHGAALANTMFARPGTSIIEIFPERRRNIDLYAHWSRIHGLDHQVVMAACSQFKQKLSIDLQDIEIAMNNCLVQRQESGTQ